jgi:hypothetical protein
VWGGKMAPCLTPPRRSTWPASPRPVAILGLGGGWMGRTCRLISSGWTGGDPIQPHRNDEVEVLVVVVSGRGELTLDGQVHQLAPMTLAHLPKGDGQSDRGRRRATRLLVGAPPPTGGTAGGWARPRILRPKGKPPGRSAGLSNPPAGAWATTPGGS